MTFQWVMTNRFSSG